MFFLQLWMMVEKKRALHYAKYVFQNFVGIKKNRNFVPSYYKHDDKL